ncbi:riboflavin kinase [Suhomyces tanzawaensis NRRL Y-17324]|uniref:Riboflavin kinase n=1 Tax=Suhomyces tanzawaensis NRRL Y-17324 TaxID=984487 RepID=A0A1E4SKG4_9ASCO|nr:riboflavin kinase [Suhomyces tanzawaensis NRRL Y-17324]ODV79927.1 riboflavin kinase [Suhomyces tanzawaensis NRRL Y-17324]
MRPDVPIPPSPQPPYPLRQESTIISGFGRGSSELGIPTANIPINDDLNGLETGIYFGWCQLVPQNGPNTTADRNGATIVFNHGQELTGAELEPLPMVMLIGWNPFYANKSKAAEVHIIHSFKDTFYGAAIKYTVLGYIRPELDYTTKEALIQDIKRDIEIAEATLATDAYKVLP